MTRASKAHSDERLSRRFLSILGASALVLTGLAGAVWAPDSHAVEGFPIIDSGSGTAGDRDPNWDIATSDTTVGGRYTSDGWVRLTDNNTSEITNLLSTQSFSADTGFVADFDYRIAGGSGLGLGDGMSFYLTDGAASVSNGGAGEGLAYASTDSGDHEEGVAGGVVGIGLDAWGQYGNSFTGSNCSRGGQSSSVAESIGIRGAGSDGCSDSDYPLIGNIIANPGGYPIATGANGSADPSTVADSQYRHVRITITPAADGTSAPTLDLAMSAPVAKDQPFGKLKSVYSGQALDAAMPATLKLGFGASTGGATCFADLRNISISALADLSISSSWNTVQPANGYAPGSPISFTLSATDLGPTALGTTASVPAANAMAMMVADLTGIPITGTPSMVGVSSSDTIPGDVDVDGATYTDNQIRASWWSGVGTTSAAGLKVSASLSTDALAGDYSFDAVIPTDFDNYTLDQSVAFVTPNSSASDPNLANNTTTLKFTVAQAPKIAWGTPKATLADG